MDENKEKPKKVNSPEKPVVQEKDDVVLQEGVPAEAADLLKVPADAEFVSPRKKAKKGKDDLELPEGIVTGRKDDSSGLFEKVISINRITKVRKGGKKLSFSALVVVGDAKGHVGYSLEKAAEVSVAIKKSMAVAKKNMIKISTRGTTIPHEIIGVCGSSRVLLKPAADGTGVIASGAVRAVCDGVGIRNILTKCHRSNNPINVIKATIDGLSRLKSVKQENKEVGIQ
ncbi:MAG: 30S ribosomal protein S5 [Candidatus Omnitrophica bacterium]|nr:30S ribosomal protein S5 [Candidatus Omnitrophota bacterium]